MKSATDKSVRDLPVTARLKGGQVVVEQKTVGVLFSFPSAVWPRSSLNQFRWVMRLTPWWDATTPDWSPRCHRLREACQRAINDLLAPAPCPKTATTR